MSVKNKKSNFASRINDLRKMGFSFECIRRVMPEDIRVTPRTLYRYSKGGTVRKWKVERELNNIYLVIYNLFIENKIGEFNGEYGESDSKN